MKRRQWARGLGSGRPQRLVLLTAFSFVVVFFFFSGVAVTFGIPSLSLFVSSSLYEASFRSPV
jgi:hypothetical protein